MSSTETREEQLLPHSGRFGDVLTAMITPFAEDGSVDLGSAKQIASHLVEAGSDGLVLVGTTGESPTLKDDEKRSLVRAVAGHLGGKVPIIVGTSTYDTEHSTELSRAAVDDGASALMAVTPYYNRPSQAGIAAHFEAIADATDLPVILYNIPGRTGSLIELDTIVSLSQHPSIVGIKDATANLAMTSRVVAATPDDFNVYSGDDALTLPMLAVGAVGVISVASHVAGRRIRKMVTMFKEGKVDAAREIHLELLNLFGLLFEEPSPGPVKAACELIGFAVGEPRLPMRSASEALRTALTCELEKLELLGAAP